MSEVKRKDRNFLANVTLDKMRTGFCKNQQYTLSEPSKYGIKIYSVVNVEA